jgi:transaldolase
MRVLLVDSADVADVARALDIGLVQGATTNPKLMRAVTDKPLEQLTELLGLGLTEAYYQPTGAYGPDLEAEAVRAHDIAPDRVVIKAMATPEGAALAAALVRRGIPVALTAAQSAAVMVTALALDCRAVIPYHDRGLRDPEVSDSLVSDLVAVRARRPGPAVVAASVKSPQQAVEVLRQGADAVTAPLPVLLALTGHPSSLAAETEFRAQYGGAS